MKKIILALGIILITFYLLISLLLKYYRINSYVALNKCFTTKLNFSSLPIFTYAKIVSPYLIDLPPPVQ